MQTRSVMLQTLCVKCENRCRYCLLSWDGKTVGADFERSKAVAKRLYDEARMKRPELQFNFAFGYSMEHPKLFEALDFLNSIDSITGRLLQMDGMRFRADKELTSFLSGLHAHGVRSLNFTFYGTREYHDRFAGRQGDYRYMLSAIERAAQAGLETSAGIALTAESSPLAYEVKKELDAAGAGSVRLFVPHSEGRGRLIEPIRFSMKDYECLEDELRPLLNRRVFKTEAEWISCSLPEESSRALLISLTDENIAEAERLPLEEIISRAEKLDDDYNAVFPLDEELIKTYGDAQGDRFFSARDLRAKYRKRYLNENGLIVRDITDERYTGARRY